MSAASHYLYRLMPGRVDMIIAGPTESEAKIIDRHFEYLQSLVSAGVALVAGRTLDTRTRTFGIVILRAASEPEARLFMENDPAVRECVMLAELFPFKLALWPANNALMKETET